MGGKLTFDLEWDKELKTFKCGSWYDGTVLRGSANKQTVSDNLDRDYTVFGGHNVVADFEQLVKWGIVPKSDFRIDDSLLALRLFKPDLPTRDLKPIAREYGIRYADEHDNPDIDELLQYCGKDSFASHFIFEKETAKKSPQLLQVLQMNCQLSLEFLAIRLAGMRVDVELLTQQDLSIQEDMNKQLASLPSGLDQSVITNDNVFRAWLQANYTPKELQALGKTATKELAIGTKLLKLLPNKPGLTEHLHAVRGLRTLYDYWNLFVHGALERTEQGYLTCDYKLLTTKSHRRATTPNMQNWPSKARSIFVSRHQDGKILSCDYRNLEARVFAWQAQCPRLLDALINGGYIRIADECFGIKGVDKASNEYRAVKAVVLGTLYGQGAWKLRHQLLVEQGITMTLRECEQYINTFFNFYPEVPQEMERRIGYLYETGCAYSHLGCRLPLPDPRAVDPAEAWKVKSIHNRAINWPTQHFASYVTGCALVDVARLIRDDQGWTMGEYLEHCWASRTYPNEAPTILPITEVHDELTCDVKPGVSTDAITQTMIASNTLRKLVPEFDCPLDVEAELKERWS